jgi:hypothetical protein
VYGRADVVDVAREGQLCGSGAAPYGVLGFEHGYKAPVAGQLNRRGEAVGAGTNDHRVVRLVASPSAHAPTFFAWMCVALRLDEAHRGRRKRAGKDRPLLRTLGERFCKRISTREWGSSRALRALFPL